MKRALAIVVLVLALAACGGGAATPSACDRAQASEHAVDARFYNNQATQAEMLRATAATDAACK